MLFLTCGNRGPKTDRHGGYQQMKVLVVGGAGYVGGAVTDCLMGSHHHVRVYDSLLYEDEYRKPVDLVVGDVRDATRLKPHLKWADTVVWLAAIVGDGACAADPALTVEINENSVGWLAQNFDRRIIFMSTCSVYGANEGLLDESSVLNPLSLYARTKLNAEKHLVDAPAMIFRLGTLFGVGDTYSRIRMDLVVNTLTARAFFYNRISVFGGNQYRPLLHVKDVAAAIVANLGTAYTGIFNLHAVNTRIVDLADQIQQHFPGLEVHRTDVKFQDNRNYRVSSDKAISTWKFGPNYTVDDGVREVKTLLAEERIRNINSPRYSNANFVKNLVTAPSTPLGYEVARGI
jgi:nucleoside-diphosphate-sugar epimerase